MKPEHWFAAFWVLVILAVVLAFPWERIRRGRRALKQAEEELPMSERRRRARAKLSIVDQCPPHVPMPDPDGQHDVICLHCRQPLDD